MRAPELRALRLKELLPEAVKRMLSRLGEAAARHRMYLVIRADTVEVRSRSRGCTPASLLRRPAP